MYLIRYITSSSLLWACYNSDFENLLLGISTHNNKSGYLIIAHEVNFGAWDIINNHMYEGRETITKYVLSETKLYIGAVMKSAEKLSFSRIVHYRFASP